MESVVAIAILWVLFTATHMGLSSRALRPQLVARLGDRGFLAVYAVVAFAVFIPLCVVYARHRHEGPLLFALPIPDLVRNVLYALQAVAWTLILGSFANPSPAAIGSAPVRGGAVNPLHRITRHPLFGGVGLFGALHVPFLGFASDVVFWAGFPVFGVLGCWHQDRRKSVEEGMSFAEWARQTSFWIRPHPSALRALPIWLPIAGVLLAWGLRYAHRIFSGAG